MRDSSSNEKPPAETPPEVVPVEKSPKPRARFGFGRESAPPSSLAPPDRMEKKRELSDDFLDLAGELLTAAPGSPPRRSGRSDPVERQTATRQETRPSVLDKTATGSSTQEKTGAGRDRTTDVVPEATRGDTRTSTSSRTLDRIRTIQQRSDRENRRPSGASSVWKVGERLLGGKYEIVELGPGVASAEGGVGVVHRVRHLEWDLDFAVKSPKPEIIRTESGKQSFERECQTWIELGLHTNIVSCYLVRRIDGVPRVFAEFVDGGTLRERITSGALYEQGPREALKRILDIAIQFAWGLDHSHQQGLLHLDVKPGNVMMAGETAKVTDFGLAKVGNRTDDTYTELETFHCEGMTPSYCSPEQYDAFLNHQKATKKNGVASKETSERESPPPTSANSGLPEPIRITRQSDIWSWGLSVLTMFHGRSPCKKGGQTAGEVFEVFLKIPPSGDRPAIPERMVPLLRRCFAKEPTDRPESLAGVADELIAIYTEALGETYPRTQPQSAAFTAESFCNRGISMLDLGKSDEAYRLFGKAAAMSVWHPQITFNQTVCAWRFGLLTDLAALHRLEELTKMNGEDPLSFYALGMLQLERGNPKGGIAALEKGGELAPDRKEIRKAIRRCKEVSENESRGITRMLLSRKTPEEPVEIWADAACSVILFPTGDSEFSLVQTPDATVLAVFKQKSSETSGRLAFSDDYKRELWRVDESTLLLKNSDPVSEVSLRPLRFGRTEPVECSGRGIRLSVKGTEVEITDLATGSPFFSLHGHERDVTALGVSSEGRWGATGSFDGTLRIWELDTGRCIRTFRGLSGAVEGIWFDAAHRFVLSIIQNTLQWWSVDLICNQRRETRAPILICDVSTSEELARRETELAARIHEGNEAALRGDFSAAVARFREAAAISGWQNVRGNLNLSERLGRYSETVGLESAVSVVRVAGHDGPVAQTAIRRDGRFALSAGQDRIVRLWQFGRPEPVHEMSGHTDWVRGVAISPDGRFGISGGWDGTIRAWNLTNGEPLRKFPSPTRHVSAVAIGPDARTIAAAAGPSIRLWDGANGRIVRTLIEDRVDWSGVRFSRDGRYLLGVSNDRVLIWNLTTGETVRRFTKFSSVVCAADCSTDMKWLFVGTERGDIEQFDLDRERPEKTATLTGHLDAVTTLSVLANRRYLISGARDRTLRVWDISTGELLKTLEGNSGGIASVAPDLTGSAVVSGADNGTVRMWNLFWEYEVRPHGIDKTELRRMLRMVAGHYVRHADFAHRKLTPSDYYGPESGKNRFIPAAELRLDDKTRLKILVEMQYRGFGSIPPDEIFKALAKLTDGNLDSLLLQLES